MKVIHMETFGARLKAERKRLNLSQEKFAAIAGASKPSQVRYESGERSPDGEYLEAIAKHGIDVNYLLTGQRSLPLSTDPMMLMIAGSAVSSVFTALGRKLGRDDHYTWALWVLDQLQGRMKDPSNGDELEEVMPEIRDLLAKRILSEG